MENLEEAAAGAEDLIGLQGVAIFAEEAAGGDAAFPFVPSDVGEEGGDEGDEAEAVVGGGDKDWPVVDGGEGAGERIAEGAEFRLAGGQLFGAAGRFGFEAAGAAHALDVARVLLF